MDIITIILKVNVKYFPHIISLNPSNSSRVGTILTIVQMRKFMHKHKEIYESVYTAVAHIC